MLEKSTQGEVSFLKGKLGLRGAKEANLGLVGKKV